MVIVELRTSFAPDCTWVKGEGPTLKSALLSARNRLWAHGVKIKDYTKVGSVKRFPGGNTIHVQFGDYWSQGDNYNLSNVFVGHILHED